MIQYDLPNGEVTSEPKVIGEAASIFFSDIFSASHLHLNEELFNHIEAVIDPSDNMAFSSFPDLQEI